MEIRGEATPAVEIVRNMKLASGESENLVTLVRAGREAGREAVKAFLSPWFTSDIEWDFTQGRWSALGFGVYRGYDEVMSYWDEMLEVFAEFRFRTEWVQAAGAAQVLGEAHGTGSFRRSGLEWDDRSFEVWTTRDGKVSRLSYCDSLEAAKEEAGR